LEPVDEPAPDNDVEPHFYHYVLILDRQDPETSSPTHTAGVDIYGAQLDTNGQTFDVSSVDACGFGTGDNEAARYCDVVIGPPDDECDPDAIDPAFVSLGGEDGYIIVSFGSLEPVVAGDIIYVYECGREQNPSAIQEYYDIYVGVGADPGDPHWVECALNATGTGVCTVPVLPIPD